MAADDEDVSFEILFLKLVDDLGTDTKSFSRHNDFETNENINQLLTEFLKNAKGKQNQITSKRLLLFKHCLLIRTIW